MLISCSWRGLGLLKWQFMSNGQMGHVGRAKTTLVTTLERLDKGERQEQLDYVSYYRWGKPLRQGQGSQPCPTVVRPIMSLCTAWSGTSLRISLILAFLFSFVFNLLVFTFGDTEAPTNCLYEFPPELRFSTYASHHLTLIMHYLAIPLSLPSTTPGDNPRSRPLRAS